MYHLDGARSSKQPFKKSRMCSLHFNYVLTSEGLVINSLNLTSTNKSISALLAQEVEHTVYYVSRSLRGVKMKYSSIERH